MEKRWKWTDCCVCSDRTPGDKVTAHHCCTIMLPAAPSPPSVFTRVQGVVTYIPAVLTPATGIKIWLGPILDLDRLIARQKEPWPLIANRGWAGCGWSQRTGPLLTLIWAAQTDVLIAWSSSILQLDRLISLWSRSRVSVQQVYMWPPLGVWGLSHSKELSLLLSQVITSPHHNNTYTVTSWYFLDIKFLYGATLGDNAVTCGTRLVIRYRS